jgi:type I restriction-modification system DNA methylase subunit
MSKNINVNPGQYNVAGRERPGEDIVHDRENAKASLNEHELREQAKRKKQQSRRPAK